MHRTLVRLLALGFLCAACGRPYSHVPPEPPPNYARAETALRRGENEDAAAQFRIYLTSNPDPIYRPRAFYQLAQAEYNQGHYQAAIDELMKLEEDYPNQRWPQVAALRGNAEFAAGNHTDGFLFWEDAWARGTESERLALQPRIQDAVESLSENELRELDELLTAPPVRIMIGARVRPGSRSFAKEQPAAIAAARPPRILLPETGAPSQAPKARKSSSAFRLWARGVMRTMGIETGPDETAPLEGEGVGQPAPELELGPGVIEVAEPGVAEPPPPSGMRVACLLPFTSPDRPYAMRVLTGLRLAFSDSPRSLIVRDSGGDPEVTRKVLTQLAADRSILGVIGPLRSNEAAAVTPLADQLRLPMLVLSQREGARGRYAVQTSMTSAQEVRALVAHATAQLGARRFGVLYPDDVYGQSFAELFREELAHRGGQLAGIASYPPGQPEFGAELATVLSWTRQGELDAVFIPDAAGVATILAATIRTRLPDVILLGTEAWNRPALIAQVGLGVEGAIFPDAFFAGSNRPSTQTFVQQFDEYARRPPTVFEAQAYDAGMLVRRAMDAGAASRDDLLTQVLSVGASFEGAGRLHATASGLERDVHLLQVRDGVIEEVAGGQPAN